MPAEDLCVIQRYASVLYILGILIAGFGVLMLLPLVPLVAERRRRRTAPTTRLC
jgi:hypothetical protein